MIVLLVEFFALLLIGALGVWAVSGRTSWSGVSTRKRRAPRELPPPQPTAFTASTGSYDP